MGKRYAVTDIHGMWSLWQDIKNYCKPDDTIYFLGDAADRGPDGIRIMKDLLEDKRVIYLKGNHEMMFAWIIAELWEGIDNNVEYWVQNGGRPTCEAILTMSDAEITDLYNKIISLPDHLIIDNAKGQHILLSHAGTSLDYTDADFKAMKYEQYYLWDRGHFLRKWPQDDAYKDYYIVHGHTPNAYIIKRFNEMNAFYGKSLLTDSRDEVFTYADGHKFGLDIATYATKKVALFDLDELKVEAYFEIKE